MHERQSAGRPRDTRLDEAIVDAALALITERGYHGLSLTAVAARAHTTTPTIYRRWTSKADLVVYAVFRTDGNDVIADTDDFADDVRSMIGWTLEKMCCPAGRAALAGLLGEAQPDSSPPLGQIATVWRRVGARLQRAIDAGDIRPDVDTDALISVLCGPALMAALLHGDAGAAPARADAIAALVLNGLRA